ncbi:unnamed protein product, partial [Cyprideis torosa]
MKQVMPPSPKELEAVGVDAADLRDESSRSTFPRVEGQRHHCFEFLGDYGIILPTSRSPGTHFAHDAMHMTAVIAIEIIPVQRSAGFQYPINNSFGILWNCVTELTWSTIPQKHVFHPALLKIGSEVHDGSIIANLAFGTPLVPGVSRTFCPLRSEGGLDALYSAPDRAHGPLNRTAGDARVIEELEKLLGSGLQSWNQEEQEQHFHSPQRPPRQCDFHDSSDRHDEKPILMRTSASAYGNSKKPWKAFLADSDLEDFEEGMLPRSILQDVTAEEEDDVEKETPDTTSNSFRPAYTTVVGGKRLSDYASGKHIEGANDLESDRMTLHSSSTDEPTVPSEQKTEDVSSLEAFMLNRLRMKGVASALEQPRIALCAVASPSEQPRIALCTVVASASEQQRIALCAVASALEQPRIALCAVAREETDPESEAADKTNHSELLRSSQNARSAFSEDFIERPGSPDSFFTSGFGAPSQNIFHENGVWFSPMPTEAPQNVSGFVDEETEEDTMFPAEIDEDGRDFSHLDPRPNPVSGSRAKRCSSQLLRPNRGPLMLDMSAIANVLARTSGRAVGGQQNTRKTMPSVVDDEEGEEEEEAEDRKASKGSKATKGSKDQKGDSGKKSKSKAANLLLGAESKKDASKKGESKKEDAKKSEKKEDAKMSEKKEDAKKSEKKEDAKVSEKKEDAKMSEKKEDAKKSEKKAAATKKAAARSSAEDKDSVASVVAPSKLALRETGTRKSFSMPPGVKAALIPGMFGRRTDADSISSSDHPINEREKGQRKSAPGHGHGLKEAPAPSTGRRKSVERPLLPSTESPTPESTLIQESEGGSKSEAEGIDERLVTNAVFCPENRLYPFASVTVEATAPKGSAAEMTTANEKRKESKPDEKGKAVSDQMPVLSGDHKRSTENSKKGTKIIINLTRSKSRDGPGGKGELRVSNVDIIENGTVRPKDKTAVKIQPCIPGKKAGALPLYDAQGENQESSPTKICIELCPQNLFQPQVQQRDPCLPEVQSCQQGIPSCQPCCAQQCCCFKLIAAEDCSYQQPQQLQPPQSISRQQSNVCGAPTQTCYNVCCPDAQQFGPPQYGPQQGIQQSGIQFLSGQTGVQCGAQLSLPQNMDQRSLQQQMAIKDQPQLTDRSTQWQPESQICIGIQAEPLEDPWLSRQPQYPTWLQQQRCPGQQEMVQNPCLQMSAQAPMMQPCPESQPPRVPICLQPQVYIQQYNPQQQQQPFQQQQNAAELPPCEVDYTATTTPQQQGQPTMLPKSQQQPQNMAFPLPSIDSASPQSSPKLQMSGAKGSELNSTDSSPENTEKGKLEAQGNTTLMKQLLSKKVAMMTKRNAADSDSKTNGSALKSKETQNQYTKEEFQVPNVPHQGRPDVIKCQQMFAVPRKDSASVQPQIYPFAEVYPTVQHQTTQYNEIRNNAQQTDLSMPYPDSRPPNYFGDQQLLYPNDRQLLSLILRQLNSLQCQQQPMVPSLPPHLQQTLASIPAVGQVSALQRSMWSPQQLPGCPPSICYYPVLLTSDSETESSDSETMLPLRKRPLRKSKLEDEILPKKKEKYVEFSKQDYTLEGERKLAETCEAIVARGLRCRRERAKLEAEKAKLEAEKQRMTEAGFDYHRRRVASRKEKRSHRFGDETSRHHRYLSGHHYTSVLTPNMKQPCDSLHAVNPKCIQISLWPCSNSSVIKKTRSVTVKSYGGPTISPTSTVKFKSSNCIHLPNYCASSTQNPCSAQGYSQHFPNRNIRSQMACKSGCHTYPDQQRRLPCLPKIPEQYATCAEIALPSSPSIQREFKSQRLQDQGNQRTSPQLQFPMNDIEHQMAEITCKTHDAKLRLLQQEAAILTTAVGQEFENIGYEFQDVIERHALEAVEYIVTEVYGEARQKIYNVCLDQAERKRPIVPAQDEPPFSTDSQLGEKWTPRRQEPKASMSPVGKRVDERMIEDELLQLYTMTDTQKTLRGKLGKLTGHQRAYSMQKTTEDLKRAEENAKAQQRAADLYNKELQMMIKAKASKKSTFHETLSTLKRSIDSTKRRLSNETSVRRSSADSDTESLQIQPDLPTRSIPPIQTIPRSSITTLDDFPLKQEGEQNQELYQGTTNQKNVKVLPPTGIIARGTGFFNKLVGSLLASIPLPETRKSSKIYLGSGMEQKYSLYNSRPYVPSDLILMAQDELFYPLVDEECGDQKDNEMDDKKNQGTRLPQYPVRWQKIKKKLDETDSLEVERKKQFKETQKLRRFRSYTFQSAKERRESIEDYTVLKEQKQLPPPSQETVPGLKPQKEFQFELLPNEPTKDKAETLDFQNELRSLANLRMDQENQRQYSIPMSPSRGKSEVNDSKKLDETDKRKSFIASKNEKNQNSHHATTKVDLPKTSSSTERRKSTLSDYSPFKFTTDSENTSRKVDSKNLSAQLQTEKSDKDAMEQPIPSKVKPDTSGDLNGRVAPDEKGIEALKGGDTISKGKYETKKFQSGTSALLAIREHKDKALISDQETAKVNQLYVGKFNAPLKDSESESTKSASEGKKTAEKKSAASRKLALDQRVSFPQLDTKKTDQREDQLTAVHPIKATHQKSVKGQRKPTPDITATSTTAERRIRPLPGGRETKSGKWLGSAVTSNHGRVELSKKPVTSCYVKKSVTVHEHRHPIGEERLKQEAIGFHGQPLRLDDFNSRTKICRGGHGMNTSTLERSPSTESLVLDEASASHQKSSLQNDTTLMLSLIPKCSNPLSFLDSSIKTRQEMRPDFTRRHEIEEFPLESLDSMLSVIRQIRNTAERLPMAGGQDQMRVLRKGSSSRSKSNESKRRIKHSRSGPQPKMFSPENIRRRKNQSSSGLPKRSSRGKHLSRTSTSRTRSRRRKRADVQQKNPRRHSKGSFIKPRGLRSSRRFSNSTSKGISTMNSKTRGTKSRFRRTRTSEKVAVRRKHKKLRHHTDSSLTCEFEVFAQLHETKVIIHHGFGGELSDVEKALSRVNRRAVDNGKSSSKGGDELGIIFAQLHETKVIIHHRFSGKLSDVEKALSRVNRRAVDNGKSSSKGGDEVG